MLNKEQEENVDYRKMYYTMAAEVENAISLLIRVQQKCEDMLLESADDAERDKEKLFVDTKLQ